MSEVKGETSAASANAQWGGRFAAGPAQIMSDINASIGFDKRMWRQDIQGSLAHASMLGEIGVISAEDEQAIADGLGAIGREIDEGRFVFETALEDIHMNIEARLTERIGDAGRPPPYRSQPQRSGRLRLQALGAGRD